jgi:serine/threonine protein kinase/WD40 repeat protein
MPRTTACRTPAELSAWLRAGVPPVEAEPFARHLEQCEACAETVDRLLSDATLAELLRSGPAAAPAASNPLIEQLIVRVRNLRADPRTVTLGPADSGERTTGNRPAAGDAATEFLSPARATGELGWLAHYRILKKLGAGGMGVVFLAEDTLLERKVALKVMQPGLAADQANRDRFLREARAAAALTHDHVVTIHQVGEANGAPYLAMQLLQGESLEGYLKRNKKLTPGQICRIGRETCVGLGAAHARGLVHRDVKPANVWLEAPKGRVKLLDFGLARSGADANLTGSGFILGTPAYMSPEQTRAGTLDGRSDLWSVGVMLYLLCTGRLPFKGGDMLATLAAIALDQPSPPRELNPEIPAALSALVMQLLAKDRDQRPKSAQEVIDRLLKVERALAKKPARDRRESPEATERLATIAKRAAGSPRRPRPTLRVGLMAGGLAAAVLAGVIVILIRNKDGSSSRLEVPDDSTVSISKDGKQVAQVGPGGGDDLPDDVDNGPAGPPPPGTPVGSYATRGGHAVAPTFLSFMRDGQRLVSIDKNTIVVRDRLGSELTRQDLAIVVRISRNAPKQFALSPDGRTLAVAANGGRLTGLVIRNLETGAEVKVLEQNADAAIQALAFSADGLMLGAGYADGKVRSWDALGWKPISEPFKVVSTVGGLAFSPSGLLAVGGTGGHVDVFDPATHATKFSAETGVEVSGLAFTPDSRTLVVLTRKEHRLLVWDVAEGKKRLEVPNGFGVLALSPDGRFAAVNYTTAPRVGGPRLIDLTTGKTPWYGAQEHGSACFALAFSPDGRTLATSGNGVPSPTVKLWDVSAVTAPAAVQAPAAAPTPATDGWKSTLTEPGFATADLKTTPLLAFVEGGQTLLVADAEHVWRRPAAGGAWTSETHAATCREQFQGEPRLAAPFPVRRLLALAVQGTGSSRIVLWGLDAARPAPRQQAPTTSTPVLDLAVSPAFAGGSEGPIIAAAYGNVVELWKVNRTEMEPLDRYDVPDASSVAFSPDAALVAAGNGRGSVRLFERSTHKERWSQVPVANNRVNAVAFSPDGRWLAAHTMAARVVTLFNVATGAEVARAESGGRQMAFSPDGRQFAFASARQATGARSVEVVDVPSGRVLGTSAQEHTAAIAAVAFAPDGKTLLSLGHDGLLKTWPLLAELVADATPNPAAPKPAPTFDDWLRVTKALPGPQRAEAVLAKMKEKNPGFEGWLRPPTVSSDVVTKLTFHTDKVFDLTPLRALTGLMDLECNASDMGKRLGRVTDLTPLGDLRESLRTLQLAGNGKLANLQALEGLRLRNLNLGFTGVTDLRPLSNLPLQSLRVGWTPAEKLDPLPKASLTYLDVRGNSRRDLSGLRGMTKLETLDVEVVSAQDVAVLRSIKSLKTIKGSPADEVLKAADQAGK